MSLKESILDIVADMEKDYTEGVPTTVTGYIRALKAACKAAGDVVKAPAYVDPIVQHRTAIEAAKQEFRGKVAGKEDEEGAKFAFFADGPEAGTAVPLHPNTPVGHIFKTKTGDFELGADGQLHMKTQLEIVSDG